MPMSPQTAAATRNLPTCSLTREACLLLGRASMRANVFLNSNHLSCSNSRHQNEHSEQSACGSVQLKTSRTTGEAHNVLGLGQPGPQPLTSIGQPLTSISQTPHFYQPGQAAPCRTVSDRVGPCRAPCRTVPCQSGPCRRVGLTPAHP